MTLGKLVILVLKIWKCEKKIQEFEALEMVR